MPLSDFCGLRSCVLLTFAFFIPLLNFVCLWFTLLPVVRKARPSSHTSSQLRLTPSSSDAFSVYPTPLPLPRLPCLFALLSFIPVFITCFDCFRYYFADVAHFAHALPYLQLEFLLCFSVQIISATFIRQLKCFPWNMGESTQK